MDQQRYYRSLDLPRWAPPGKLFGIVWPFLYVLILISFGWSLLRITNGDWSAYLLVPIIFNLVTNILYTPLFFRWKQPLLATLDNYIVVATLLWFMVAVHNYALWPALILLPYLAWTSFASVLQTEIYRRNR